MTDQKKEPKFKKIEDGMLYMDEEGETLAVGFPKKIRKAIGGKGGATLNLNGLGGEISGEKVSDIELDWVFVSDERFDVDTLKDNTLAVSTASGTMASSATTAMTLPSFVHHEWRECPNCGEPILQDSKFCRSCGERLD